MPIVRCCGSFVMVDPLERVGNLIKGRIIGVGNTPNIPNGMEKGKIVYYNPTHIDSTILIDHALGVKFHFIKYYNIAAIDDMPKINDEKPFTFSGFSDMSFQEEL